MEKKKSNYLFAKTFFVLLVQNKRLLVENVDLCYKCKLVKKIVSKWAGK